MWQTQSEIDSQKKREKSKKILFSFSIFAFCAFVAALSIFAAHIHAEFSKNKIFPEETAVAEEVENAENQELPSKTRFDLAASIHEKIDGFDKSAQKKVFEWQENSARKKDAAAQNKAEKIKLKEREKARKEEEKLAKIEARKSQKLERERIRAERKRQKRLEKIAKRENAKLEKRQKAEARLKGLDEPRNETIENPFSIEVARNLLPPETPPPPPEPPVSTAADDARPAQKAKKPQPQAAPKPKKKRDPPYKIAVVLDDAGYNFHDVERFLDLEIPVTVAVLPNATLSAQVAQRVRNSGKELILHQPMQAKDYFVDPGENALTPTMTDKEIYETLQKNLAEVGPVAGINNHEGSLVTEDEREMSVVFDFCEDNSLFFLDSKTSNEKITRNLARSRGMKILERDIFLDNNSDYDSILNAFESGLKVAERHGSAIFIGHVKSSALAACIRNNIESWQSRGFVFVNLSEMAK